MSAVESNVAAATDLKLTIVESPFLKLRGKRRAEKALKQVSEKSSVDPKSRLRPNLQHVRGPDVPGTLRSVPT